MAVRKTEVVQPNLKEKLVTVAEDIVSNLEQFKGNLNQEQIKMLETAMSIFQLTKE